MGNCAHKQNEKHWNMKREDRDACLLVCIHTLSQISIYIIIIFISDVLGEDKLQVWFAVKSDTTKESWKIMIPVKIEINWSKIVLLEN